MRHVTDLVVSLLGDFAVRVETCLRVIQSPAHVALCKEDKGIDATCIVEHIFRVQDDLQPLLDLLVRNPGDTEDGASGLDRIDDLCLNSM